MRALPSIGFCGVALVSVTVSARADVRSYCEAYARYQADVRLSGGAILGAKSKITAAERGERKTLALADCVSLYTPKPRIEPVTAEPQTAPEKPITTVRTRIKNAVTPKPKRQTVTATVPAQHKESVTSDDDSPWKSFDNPLTPSRR